MAVTNKRGIFALLDVRERQATDNWSVKSDVWLAPSPYYVSAPETGYFGGGSTTFPATLVSTVDRIDYSNDTSTASPKGPLSVAKELFGATGNASYGWFGGDNTNQARVDRIDYSNDTATASVRGSLLYGGTQKSGATGNSSYGYYQAGYPPYDQSRISRIDYSNDTATSAPVGSLAQGRIDATATGNQSYGYFAGGRISAFGNIVNVDRIDYSNDTSTASPKGPLSLARSFFAATGNSSFGYFGGGTYPTPQYSTVDRIDYSNDTITASPKGPLSYARHGLAATGNSSFGYFGGGTSGNYPSPAISIIDRIDYSNDTATASPKGPLSTVRGYLAASSALANGLPASPVLIPAPPGGLTNFGTGAVVTPNTGYFGGGYIVSTVDRIDYSNDTATTSPKGPLSLARGYLAATGNSSYGYFGGGDSPATAVVDRIDYSNDTATASPRGPLTQGRSAAATGNSSFGYFGGGRVGNPAPNVTTVDRIDYSNDTATATPKGPLTVARGILGATGNSSYGWFGGGYPSFSTVDRIDYSNDTATASPRGTLSQGRQVSATGNSNYGWFGGAHFPTAGSTVDRIDYSNDTATASPKGPLSVAKGLTAATGNSSFGYFGGGYTTVNVSSVDRIDYSNDTATASPKGPLSLAKQGLAASSARANALPAVDLTLPPANSPVQVGKPDPYFNSVSLLLHGDGTNGSTTFVDSSSNNFTITPAGNAQISTTQSKFGGASVRFLADSTDHLYIPASSSLQITGADDFTVEAWIYLLGNRTYNYFVSKGGGATREWAFAAGPTNLRFYWSTNGAGSGDSLVVRAATLPLNTWMHVAAVKSGSTIKLFKDGQQQGADGTFTSIYSGNGTFWVGRFMDFGAISHSLNGHIDDLRITKGVARYTSNFTPPAQPFFDLS